MMIATDSMQRRFVAATNPPPELRRWRVIGRNHFFCHEIGYFFGRSPFEAIAEARRRKGHLCGGLRLEAEGRL